MKKTLLILMLAVLVQLVSGAQDPGLVFCQLQGHDAVFSVTIQYEGKTVQFIPGNHLNDEIIFPVALRKEDKSGIGYFDVKEIYGLSDDEKKELIQKIENEISFGEYTIEKVNTVDGYGLGWLYKIVGDFEIFTYCDFPNGHDCKWTDFRDKKCGLEYMKEIPCIKVGESIRGSFQECCEGLEVYNPRPGCDGCLPICRVPPNNVFIRLWEWIRSIFS
ncbi:MAG: hypothetical protein KAK00_10790 [Nanoarchaeota archaeon]|nr:hypothetical protein [Nanoarchaeota archaeon]